MAVSRLPDALPPHNDEAEMAALGAMLIDKNAADLLVAYLKPEDFYQRSHEEIFRAMLAVAKSSRQIDDITVRAELDVRGKLDAVGGPEYLYQLAEFVPSAANAEYYGGIVRDLAMLRALQEAARQIVTIVHDGELSAEEKADRCEHAVFEAAQKRTSKEFMGLEHLMQEYFLEVDRNLELGEPLHGMPTGFLDIDRMLTGLYPGNLVILAARPGVGKTSLALRLALNAAKISKKSIAIFSLEMSQIELARRLVAMEAGVDSNILKRSRISDEDYHRIADACDRLFKLKVFVDDSSDITHLQMRAKCRRLEASQHDLGLIVVDYLQLIQPITRSDNRAQQIAEIARALKIMSKELNVPVLALSQLSRSVEQRENKRPMLSDLRESGAIESDADVVLLLYREDMIRKDVPGDQIEDVPTATRVVPVEVIIGKNRNGPTGTITLAFQPAFTRFSDAARYE
ncbi:MAG: replicative DNA helicase [Armatimonadetes bacterium]|nr:MAG: replicative DNA helicase [Armatimonadota bacterium]MCE7899082.1 replicative DNA helicase [Armatimonadetes bacterium ATM1]MDL1927537.1 replicative DNA helicase [Fimbriimonadia bacterium ATM]MBC6969814.1 replicative DNA helicase [Armatimonadota bacterium]MBL1149249.1 replicative DNA helicase [Armatimonadota bacterium]